MLQLKGVFLNVILTGGGIVMTNCHCQLELAEAPAAVVERLTIKYLQL